MALREVPPIASWDQVDTELEGVEASFRRLELAIPERIPGAPNLGAATRIVALIEGAHALVELIRGWSTQAKKGL